jgi:hypothetical protein
VSLPAPNSLPKFHQIVVGTMVARRSLLKNEISSLVASMRLENRGPISFVSSGVTGQQHTGNDGATTSGSRARLCLLQGEVQ